MKAFTYLQVLVAIIVTVNGMPQHRESTPEPADANTTRQSSSAPFVHPGVFVDLTRLQFMNSKVGAKEQPWTSAYDALARHRYATRTSPKPVPTVNCGPYSDPNVGCTDERADSMAAYANALMWAATKDKSKAERAISFMNAWARTIKTHTNSNAPLQAAWSAANWARAGEIIRYTGAGWSEADIKAFEAMLRQVYLPRVRNGSRNPNNWELMCNEATVGIAVFLNDRATYDAAISRFIRSTAQYFYLKKDGARPVKPAGMTDDQQNWWWNGQIARNLEDGIGMEICRDLTHTGYAIASVSHVIETCKIQGRDLYQEEAGTRLGHALEFHTKYDRNGGALAVPSWLCGGKLSLHLEPISEPGWNALGRTSKMEMPNTRKFTERNRPAGANTLFIGWETLTHAQ